jgi:hypothetical protein
MTEHANKAPGRSADAGSADVGSADVAGTEEATMLSAWFLGRVPDGWFTDTPDVWVDRDEIVVVGRLPEPELGGLEDDGRLVALDARISGFREDTRAERMRIADGAEARFGRRVAWGAECGSRRVLFTSLSVPVMTRLRMPERRVLDTLVDAGVARSRSDALAWCVRLVREHEGEWIDELREALVHVEAVRKRGPGARATKA